MPKSSRRLVIGARASQLSRWQADHVASRLIAFGVEASIEYIKTTGDLDQVTDFGAMGAKGIFVKEIEAALLDGRIDLAVHSLKDLPTDLPEGLVLGAALERTDPRDALVSNGPRTLDDFAKGSIIATGSLRRAAQVLALRPDLQIVPLRGNVPTRVRKIREGQADATLLAVAGLERLGLESEIAQRFSVEEVTPAMGQGALAVETREGELTDLLEALQHVPTRWAIDAERVFISKVGGGCKTPVGVLAEAAGDDRWKITAVLASSDGRSLIRETRAAQSPEDLNPAAIELARHMLASADEAILATLGEPTQPGSAKTE